MIVHYRQRTHPNYKANTAEYDFALLRLKNAVDFASFPNVFPACWPTQRAVPGDWVKLCPL